MERASTRDPVTLRQRRIYLVPVVTRRLLTELADRRHAAGALRRRLEELTLLLSTPASLEDGRAVTTRIRAALTAELDRVRASSDAEVEPVDGALEREDPRRG